MKLGRSSVEAIHLIRIHMEKYRERQRDLHMAFHNLDKRMIMRSQEMLDWIGIHQGSVISPYMFTLILDELSRGIQEDHPWCLIFPDDIVLVSEWAKGLNIRLENWR
ncbi:retrovirus-related pol polyprotein LINE-1 [Tanacetum coccineum]